jgi:hypothetical protein
MQTVAVFAFFLAAGTQATASPDALHRLITATNRNHQQSRSDEFHDEPSDVWALGQSFRMFVRLSSQDSLQPASELASGSYRYGPAGLDVYLSNPPGFYETPTVVHGPSYYAHTALGVSMRVTVAHTLQRGITVLNLETPERASFERGYYRFRTVLPVHGEEARRIAEEGGFVIEGTLAKLTSGRLAECKTLRLSPALDHPYAGTITDCLAGANVIKVTFRASEHGTVLATWTRDAGSEYILDNPRL